MSADAWAGGWWEAGGRHRLLHVINPVRLAYVEERAGGLEGKRVLDAGCGGGLLAEAMARRGAEVTGIDSSPGAIAAARGHAGEEGLQVEYVESTCAAHAAGGGEYDVVTCMEMLEHVDDPAAAVADLASMVGKGGSLVLSTVNRTPVAGLLMIGVLECGLGVIDRGTHEYRMFRTPSEVGGWCRDAGLRVADVAGANWSFFGKTFLLSRTAMPVNYFLHARAR